MERRPLGGSDLEITPVVHSAHREPVTGAIVGVRNEREAREIVRSAA